MPQIARAVAANTYVRWCAISRIQRGTPFDHLVGEPQRDILHDVHRGLLRCLTPHHAVEVTAQRAIDRPQDLAAIWRQPEQFDRVLDIRQGCDELRIAISNRDAAAAQLDPKGMLNPGVLIDP
jgi:hypothetical protein